MWRLADQLQQQQLQQLSHHMHSVMEDRGSQRHDLHPAYAQRGASVLAYIAPAA